MLAILYVLLQVDQNYFGKSAKVRHLNTTSKATKFTVRGSATQAARVARAPNKEPNSYIKSGATKITFVLYVTKLSSLQQWISTRKVNTVDMKYNDFI